jgi:hypothetical protein
MITTVDAREGGRYEGTAASAGVPGCRVFALHAHLTLRPDRRCGFTGYNAATGAILSSSYKLVDPYTLEITQTTRTSGKVTSVNTVTRTVSRDRKTLTLKTNGSKFATVWDRQ